MSGKIGRWERKGRFYVPEVCTDPKNVGVLQINGEIK